MTKAEALIAAINGEKIWHDYMTSQEYIMFDGNVFCDHRGILVHLKNVPNSGWQIYKPKPKKVKMWLWVYQYNSDGVVKQSTSYFQTEEEARRRLGSGRDFIILFKDEKSEIEVEVE